MGAVAQACRRLRFRGAVLPVVVAALLWGDAGLAEDLAWERVASGLSQPIFVASAPGRPDELFIAERGGAIRLLHLDSAAPAPTPFLQIPGVQTAGEGGLLGLAFHPEFADNGRFYAYVTLANEIVSSPFSSHILEFRVTDPLGDFVAEPDPRQILSFVQPQSNHNAGWIGFSPLEANAYLYIMSGDGGGANDTGEGHTPGIGNSQDLTDNLLGKVLRIDVDGDDFPNDAGRNYAIPPDNPFRGGAGDDEIFAYGLRNPFRAGFDRETGDLYIGDVGQNRREEIDLLPYGSPGGENYGWRAREGDGRFSDVPPPDNVDPIYSYNHGNGDFEGNSVTGGIVYRGPVAAFVGLYIFADFTSNRIWSFDPQEPAATVERIDDIVLADVGSVTSIVAFGEDARGDLYAVDLGGEVFRLIPEPSVVCLLGAAFLGLASLRRSDPA